MQIQHAESPQKTLTVSD